MLLVYVSPPARKKGKKKKKKARKTLSISARPVPVQRPGAMREKRKGKTRSVNPSPLTEEEKRRKRTASPYLPALVRQPVKRSCLCSSSFLSPSESQEEKKKRRDSSSLILSCPACPSPRRRVEGREKEKRGRGQ